MPKIPEYPALTSPSNNDQLVIEDSVTSSTKSVTREAFLKGTPLPASTVDGQAIAANSVDPSKRSGGFKIGIIPSATVGTTGNKAITGVGFMPKLVKFTILFSNLSNFVASSTGAMDGIVQFAFCTSTDEGAGVGYRSGDSTCAIKVINSSGSTILRAIYVSFDADGFTINVTSANSPFDIAYEAYA